MFSNIEVGLNHLPYMSAVGNEGVSTSSGFLSPLADHDVKGYCPTFPVLHIEESVTRAPHRT